MCHPLQLQKKMVQKCAIPFIYKKSFYFKIAAGVVAVYYLLPRGSGMVKEEVLSRHSRSLDEIEILTAENKTKIIELGSDDSNQCFSGKKSEKLITTIKT